MAATVGRVRSPGSPALRLRGACLLVAAALGATTLTGPPEAPEPNQNRRTTVEATDANPTRRTLAVTSEGLAGIGATEWQAAGHTGAGTKVAIIDLGFDGWEDLPEGELPAGVEAMGFDSTGALDTGTDHGTQMAEIIHDVAPDAKLVLVTFNDNYMDEMVTWLLANEVDVVSMSLEWTDGPIDGTHFSAEHIQRGIDSGITWVIAAGNSAKRHHVGTTVDNDGDGWVELMSPTTEFNEFLITGGATADLLLTWDNPATDLD
ncbi:MAG: S8 family serine peptidase, partial [Acidimicrobiales bacterium]|nr:S8 family serine peptidase [Acidimicrobiales bacterium]